MSDLLRALAETALAPDGRERLWDMLAIGRAPTPAEHHEMFGVLLYPHAAVYLGAEGMFGGDAEDRVAGFWRALGAEVPARPDHLATLLLGYASLVDLHAERPDQPDQPDRGERALHASRALLWEHIASWLPVFAIAARDVAPAPYREWAGLLDDVLRDEVRGMGEMPELPLHLREAPPLADPRQEGGKAFLASLLAPARCGFVLTRLDLARLCERAGLGLRQGERRYALASMFGQDAARTFAELSAHAERWTRLLDDLDPALGAIRGFWRARARAAVELFASVSDERELAGATFR